MYVLSIFCFEELSELAQRTRVYETALYPLVAQFSRICERSVRCTLTFTYINARSSRKSIMYQALCNDVRNAVNKEYRFHFLFFNFMV